MQPYRYATTRLIRLPRHVRTPRNTLFAYSTSADAVNVEPIHEPAPVPTPEPVAAADQPSTSDNVVVPTNPSSAPVSNDGAAGQSAVSIDSPEGKKASRFEFPPWAPQSGRALLDNMYASLTKQATSFGDRHTIKFDQYLIPAELEVYQHPGPEHESASEICEENVTQSSAEEPQKQLAIDPHIPSWSFSDEEPQTVRRVSKKEAKKAKKERKKAALKASAKNSDIDLSKDPFLSEAVAMARQAKELRADIPEVEEKETWSSTSSTLLKREEAPHLNGDASELEEIDMDEDEFALSTSKKSKKKPVKPRGLFGTFMDRDIYYEELMQSSPPEHVHNGRPSLPLSYIRRVEGLLEPKDVEVDPKDLEPPSEHRPIAQLAHGLDRVLFNPGVHWLQDPRSHVFNFTPWLQAVPKVQDFDFERVQGFIKSSQDDDLYKLAKQEKCLFTGSTSSLTGMLSHIYMMLSREKLVDTSNLSAAFQDTQRNFTPGQKLPVSIVLRHKDGIYSTDSNPSDPGASEKNVLTWMGTMLEKFLTVPEDEFGKFLRSSPPLEEEDDGKREAYRYARFGDYIMRSQLDCQDPRLPGTGVFDIKTRAALPIRVDLMNWEENSGYLIRSLQGNLESFEREYYDLIRSAFLKYSFQARIGNMDGVLVTYHNTARIFGFQYVPLEEMDERLYGNKDAGLPVFKRCFRMLEIINKELISHFPGRSISTVWESYPDKSMMRVWAEPVEEENDNVAGEEGDAKTIIELEIYTINYLDQEPVKGWAIPEALPDGEWTIHYKMFLSSAQPNTLRQRRQTALDKQISYWALPTGVPMEKAEEYFSNINYSGKTPSASGGPARGSSFKQPDTRVEELRELARRGKRDSERSALERAGKRKIVWGVPDTLDAVDETDVVNPQTDEDPEIGSLLNNSPQVKTVREVDDVEVAREVELSKQPESSADVDVPISTDDLVDTSPDQPTEPDNNIAMKH